jgi:hypothetical protein
MEPTTPAATDAASKPVQVFRRDAISVSIFANETLRDGKPAVFYKATISKIYKRKDSEGFARTSSFEAKDFPTIRTLLIQAGAFIETLESGAKPEAPTGK